MNIVSMALQYLTPVIIDRIATALGVQSPMIRSAIAAIVPSILAGLTGVAAKPGGGTKITDILGKQNTDILGDLGNIFGGERQTELAKSGSKDLGDLLGGSAVNGLSGAVSKFAGLGNDQTQSLLGMLAPVALGALAQQQKAEGLDADGLSKLLVAQKDNIGAAMPEGFDKLLAGTGLLDAIAPAAAAAAPAAPAARAAPAKPVDTPASSGGGMWTMLLAAVALAVGGWYYLKQNATVSLPAVPQISSGNQNIGAQLGSVAEGLRSSLVKLKDEASAKAALPRLQEMAKQLDGINTTATKLAAPERSSLAKYAAQLLPVLRPMIERAIAAAGVGPVAKPVLEQILGKLDTLAKA